MKLTAEDFQFTPPAIAEAQAAAALRDLYGLSGDLKSLSGERDRNFRLTAPDGRRFVVKISGPREDPATVDFQNSVLLHLEETKPALPLPRLSRTRSGDPVGRIETADGTVHMLRVLSYVEGLPYSIGGGASLAAARNAGLFMGSFCQALAGFSHPAERGFMTWDLTNGLLEDERLWRFGRADIRAQEARLRPYIAEVALPMLKAQRSQVIHHDAHQDNLLRAAPQCDEVVGLIDFGDMIRAPLICEPAILALGFIELGEGSVALGAAAVAGFDSAFPLTGTELDMLYDVILMREVQTVLLFDFKINQNASNSELVRWQRPGFLATLSKLLEIGPAPFAKAIREACNQDARETVS